MRDGQGIRGLGAVEKIEKKKVVYSWGCEAFLLKKETGGICGAGMACRSADLFGPECKQLVSLEVRVGEPALTEEKLCP